MDLRLTGALVVALATLSASGKVIPTECPKHDLTNHTVHLAHESDCTKFYKCENGKKVVFDCPVYNEEGDKLYFNVTLRSCNWPENVDCKRPQPIVAIPSRVGVPTKCPKRNWPNVPLVHLAHENDCTKFYKCDWGKKVPFDCPIYNKENDRLHFNPKLQVCDWPDKFDCKLPFPNNRCIGTCPNKNTYPFSALLAHKDCTKFCICSDGVAYVQYCAGDFPYWSHDKKKCSKANEVVCSIVKSLPKF